MLYTHPNFGRSHILFLSIAAVSGTCDWCGRDTCQRHPLRDLAETEPHVPQTDGKIPPEDLKKWVLNLRVILYLQRKYKKIIYIYMDNFSHINHGDPWITTLNERKQISEIHPFSTGHHNDGRNRIFSRMQLLSHDLDHIGARYRNFIQLKCLSHGYTSRVSTAIRALWITGGLALMRENTSELVRYMTHDDRFLNQMELQNPTPMLKISSYKSTILSPNEIEMLILWNQCFYPIELKCRYLLKELFTWVFHDDIS